MIDQSGAQVFLNGGVLDGPAEVDIQSARASAQFLNGWSHVEHGDGAGSLAPDWDGFLAGERLFGCPHPVNHPPLYPAWDAHQPGPDPNIENDGDCEQRDESYRCDSCCPGEPQDVPGPDEVLEATEHLFFEHRFSHERQPVPHWEESSPHWELYEAYPQVMQDPSNEGELVRQIRLGWTLAANNLDAAWYAIRTGYKVILPFGRNSGLYNVWKQKIREYFSSGGASSRGIVSLDSAINELGPGSVASTVDDDSSHGEQDITGTHVHIHVWSTTLDRRVLAGKAVNTPIGNRACVGVAWASTLFHEAMHYARMPVFDPAEPPPWEDQIEHDEDHPGDLGTGEIKCDMMQATTNLYLKFMLQRFQQPWEAACCPEAEALATDPLKSWFDPRTVLLVKDCPEVENQILEPHGTKPPRL